MDPHAHESLEGEAEGTASSSSLPSSRTHANLSATISRPAPPGGRRPAHRTTSGAFSGPRPTSAAGREPRPGRAETGLGAERREMGTTSPSLDANRSPVPAVVEIPKEEIEKALEGLSRDDLVMALGRAKVQMDQLDAKLETQTLSLESLHVFASDVASKLSLSEAEVESLTVAISQREERVDELLREQERMEDEVYARMEVVERLRKQLDESQKSKAEAERRYHDQTATMDKEQQYFADMEALFKSQQSSTSAQNIKLSAQNEELLKENERMTNRLAQLQATQRSMRSTSRIDDQAEVDDGRKERESADVEEQSDLEVPHDDQPESALRSPVRTLADEAAQAELKSLGEELSNLRKSHSSLTDTMHQLQAELRQVKEANVVLQDQNETYMDILQEKTFSGALLAESAVLNRSYIGSGGRGSISNEGSSVGEDEDLAERDDPDSSFGGADEAAAPDADEDDVPDRPASPVTPRALVHPSVKGRSRSRRDTVRSRRSDANFLQPPTDLASELERSEDAEEDAKGGNGMSAAAREERRRNRRRERSGTVSDDVGVLQKEVRELRDANQALTLYISKIIDRIIAKEGYENILAVEGEGKRPSRGTTRSKARARPSILPTRSTPEPSSNGKQDADGDDSITSQPAPADDVKAGRRQSIGLLGFGRSSAASPEAGNSTSPAAQGAPPKARRTASIDWRSLLGGSPQPEKEQSNPNLRPLALQGTSPMLGLGPSSARKVETAEDEEDAREIERIRASLQLQGITPPEHQLRPGPLSPSGSSSASGSSRLPFSTFFQRVTSGGSATSVGDSKSDFQERLTTFDDPSPARRPTPSVEARATLAQLEQREKAQAAALAAGGGSGLTEYVKPSRPVRERSGSTRSSISRGSSVAGDESYTLPDAGASPAFSTTGLPGENTKPGWLKRLSMPFTGDVNMSTSVQTPTQQVSVPSQVREGSAEP